MTSSILSAATLAAALLLGASPALAGPPRPVDPARPGEDIEAWTTPPPVRPEPAPTMTVARPCSPCDDYPAEDPCGPACRAGFEARLRYWLPSIDGTTFITRGGEPGTATTVDLNDDVGLDWGNGVEAGLSYAFPGGRHRVFASYEWVGFDADEVLDEALVFRGSTFAAGSKVETSLDLYTWKVGYDYAWMCRPTFESRVGVSGWIWTFDQEMRTVPAGPHESRDFTHVLPVVHLSADAWWGRLHAGAVVAGGWIGTDRWTLDLEGKVGARLFDRMTLDLGWKWRRFVFDETTNEGDFTLSGPFVELTVDL